MLISGVAMLAQRGTQRIFRFRRYPGVHHRLLVLIAVFFLFDRLPLVFEFLGCGVVQ